MEQTIGAPTGNGNSAVKGAKIQTETLPKPARSPWSAVRAGGVCDASILAHQRARLAAPFHEALVMGPHRAAF
jgi:hypothetical protein